MFWDIAVSLLYCLKWALYNWLKSISPGVYHAFGTFLCGVSYAMLAFDYSMITLMVSMTLLCIGEIWCCLYVYHYCPSFRENNKGAYMGMNGMSISIAFIITLI
ncbi:hypothetical protein EJ377_03825 [Chryseobacterium arthrosphaerae]|uniref:Uncharacterized protein n=1 Tax=Chryseobacterium arthrosphaerae TaxID=651561 RepID=A0A3S0NNR7_9FLAO|nr:hypothetical protein EJ377_03825 [Chryseobacterium arthrosphaerae]